jgi:regulator of sigma E protease
MPTIPDSPAARAKLVKANRRVKEEDAKLKSGDTIVRVGDTVINNYRELAAAIAKNPDRDLVVQIERPLKTANTKAASRGDEKAPAVEELSFEIPAQPFRHFGLVTEIGPITAIQKGSPAEAAGVKRGDRIVQVDGKPIADGENQGNWTPMTLPEYLQRAAANQREVEFAIQRAKDGNTDEVLTIRMKPVEPIVVPSEIPLGAPIAADAVGIAYNVRNEVHAVLPNGPAADADIVAGDRLVSAKVHLPPDKDGNVQKAEEIKLDDEQNWPAIVDAVQFAPAGTEVELQLARGDNAEPITVKLSPQPVDGVFDARRGFLFEPIFRERVATSFAEQVQYGWEETVDALTMVFRFLQKLGGQVPFKMLGGPGTIAVAAGGAADQGLASLLIFLTMLSANLAVINFLPIPLLDGGHMVFLAYEGIRGRPANEKFVLALHMAGFVFIIGLMIFVIGLDIQRWLLT